MVRLRGTLAELAGVGLARGFSEDTPLELIREVEPDLSTKGPVERVMRSQNPTQFEPRGKP